MEAITSFNPTPPESALVDRIFAVGDPQGTGSISPDVALSIFVGSRLPTDTLEEIWDIANVEENPTYGKYVVGIAVRLVGHLQNGKELSEELVLTRTCNIQTISASELTYSKAGSLADMGGLETARGGSNYTSLHPSSGQADPFSDSAASNSELNRPPLPHALSNLPPLTEQDRNKFMQIFNRSGPENGVLSGPRGREILMKSRLPVNTLGDIWYVISNLTRVYPI